MSHLAGFLALALVIVVIPGPATTLVASNALRGGFASGARTGLGLLLADLLWMTASVIGLTALLVASQVAFDALRFAGAVYLVVLGVRLLVAGHGPSEDTPRRTLGAVRSGLLCNLSNPKTLLVFTSVIPQLAPASPTGLELALYGTLFALVGFGSSLGYAALFARAGRGVRQSRIGAALSRVSGAILVAFGVRLATEPV